MAKPRKKPVKKVVGVFSVCIYVSGGEVSSHRAYGSAGPIGVDPPPNHFHIHTTRARLCAQVVFLSSVGVLRTKQVPFNILNLCGVLDAKRDSEELLKSLGAYLTFLPPNMDRDAKSIYPIPIPTAHSPTPPSINPAATEEFDYLIVRPGRLVGGPWTNTDVSNLLKVEEGTRKRVVVERGDALNGDAARISVAELVVRVRLCFKYFGCGSTADHISHAWLGQPNARPPDKQALDQPGAMNEELCLTNEEGAPLSAADWDALFQKLG